LAMAGRNATDDVGMDESTHKRKAFEGWVGGCLRIMRMAELGIEEKEDEEK